MISAVVLAAAFAATPITLEQVRQESRGNTQALLSELDRQRAQAQVTQARSAIYPHVALNGTAGGQVNGPRTDLQLVPSEINDEGEVTAFAQKEGKVRTSTSRASFELSATVNQLLYDGGKWWNQISQANAQLDAQAGQTQEQQLASELEGVRRFFDLYKAQETSTVLEANAKRSEQLLERAKALFDAGRAQGVDVYSAQVNLGNDQLEVVRQRSRIADAQGRLATWLLRPGSEELIAQAPPLDSAQPAPSVQDALKSARETRPLMHALNQTLHAAELGKDVAQGDRLPTVSAQLTAGRQGAMADPFFIDPAQQNFVQGGLNIRWDAFTGFRTSAQVEQAQIERRRAEVQLAQAERELEAEVRSAVILYETQLAAAQISEANLAAAKKGLELATARFETGAGSTIEVRDAQLKLTQSELSLLQNRIDVEVARAALDRTLGRGVAQ